MHLRPRPKEVVESINAGTLNVLPSVTYGLL